jgi:hypothetical protein
MCPYCAEYYCCTNCGEYKDNMILVDFENSEPMQMCTECTKEVFENEGYIDFIDYYNTLPEIDNKYWNALKTTTKYCVLFNIESKQIIYFRKKFNKIDDEMGLVKTLSAKFEEKLFSFVKKEK